MDNIRTCSKCNENKSIFEFSIAGKNGKRRFDCKSCIKIYNDKYHNRTEQIERRKQNYDRNIDKNLSYAKDYRAKNKKLIKKKREERKNQQRNNHLKRKYNIDQIKYDELLKEQNYKCAICETSEAGGTWNIFYVDHVVKCKDVIVRGLLCFNCNTALGKFREKPMLLEKALEYTKRYE